jgi:hypothetical protein
MRLGRTVCKSHACRLADPYRTDETQSAECAAHYNLAARLLFDKARRIPRHQERSLIDTSDDQREGLQYGFQLYLTRLCGPNKVAIYAEPDQAKTMPMRGKYRLTWMPVHIIGLIGV